MITEYHTGAAQQPAWTDCWNVQTLGKGFHLTSDDCEIHSDTGKQFVMIIGNFGGKGAVGLFLRCKAKILKPAIHFKNTAKMRIGAWSPG